MTLITFTLSHPIVPLGNEVIGEIYEKNHLFGGLEYYSS